MTEVLDRVKAAIRSEFGGFSSPRKTERAALAVLAALKLDMDELGEAEATARERSRFFDAICWALGMAHEGFAERQEGQGAYWWRTELRRRAWPDGFPHATQHWKERNAGVPEPEWARD